MTVTTTPPAGGGLDRPVDMVTLTIDGYEVSVPKGTLIIRAAELIGVQVPRFCDHPLLEPVGACRQCMVEVEGQRKPLTSCTTTVTDGMVVRTQLTSEVADKAQHGVMEMLLVNHPLDCPVCDKGGECPLQNQAMSNGRPETRFDGVKRTFAKPIAISSQVLLDRERCVQCARCTRFSEQIAGDPFIELFERGALEQVAVFADEPFHSYFSGNTVQICPVGALTGTAYRFRARPFDLVSTASACEHCASGCAMRTDWRRGTVLRRLAGDDPEVNAEWNCDKGRWAFTYATQPDRISGPLGRDEQGYLVPISWSDALDRAARGLGAARGRAGVLTGGRLSVEDAYAYAKFARVALGTNDVDFRARPHSREEEDFLASRVAGRYPGHPGSTTYADIDAAPAVLLVGFEPEEESPIVFLRLRKAVRTSGLRVYAVAPMASAGLAKLTGTLLATTPGDEAHALRSLIDGGGEQAQHAAAAAALRTPGALVLVGERAATAPGTLSAVAALADATGARIGWIPRRAGDRGALDAGALPGLLPGGRPLGDAGARAKVAGVWGAEVPALRGRDLTGILTAAADGSLGALLVAGVDPVDLPDPDLMYAALAAVPFIVSLELRESPVTQRADVVLPVAAAVEKDGTFLDWEGRTRTFGKALHAPGLLPDGRVLHELAGQLGVDLALPDPDQTRREIARLGAWAGELPPAPTVPAPPRRRARRGQATLSTWHLLLDNGRLQDGEPHLAGTAKPARVHLSAATAAEIGAVEDGEVRVSTAKGSVTLPLTLADLPDRVVWLPTNSGGCRVRADLGADSGDLVAISAPQAAPVGATAVPAARGRRWLRR